MSLKAFHIVFIVASVLCALFYGTWAVVGFLMERSGFLLTSGLVALLAAVVLIVYGNAFLKKFRDIGYL